MAPDLQVFLSDEKATALERALPRLIAPFNPQDLGGYVQQICARETAGAFGVRKFSAQASEIVVKHVPEGTFCNLFRAIRCTTKLDLAATGGILNR